MIGRLAHRGAAALLVIPLALAILAVASAAAARDGDRTELPRNETARPDTEMRFEELYDQASRLVADGKIADAEPIARAALALLESMHPADEDRILRGTQLLATILGDLEQTDEAVAVYLRIIMLRERAFADDTAGLATNNNDLALVLDDAGRYGEAETYYKRALAFAEKAWSADHQYFARILANLGLLYFSIGEMEKAETVQRRVLAILEKATPVDAKEMARGMNDMGITLERLSRLDEAAEFHRRAIAIASSAFPEDDPRTLISLSNLATVLYHLKRFDEAAALNRRVLASRERTLPPNDPEIATALSNLGMVTTNRAEAERVLRRALEIRKRVLPPGDPDIATSMNNLALQLDGSQTRAEVERLYRDALAIRRRSLPPGHPRIAQSMVNLGSLLDDIGQDKEAGALYREALGLNESRLPPNHPEIAINLVHLASIAAELHDYAEALELYARAADIRAAAENRATVAAHDWRFQAENRLSAAEGLWRSGGASGEAVRQARQDAFVDLQRAGYGGTGAAVAAAAARARANAPELDRLARERDGDIARLAALEATFLQVSSKTDMPRDERTRRLVELRGGLDVARREIDELEGRIQAIYPAYVALAESSPATIEMVQPLLRENDALLFVTPYAGAGFLFAVTRDAELYESLPRTDDAAALAARLRCSAAFALDPACRARSTAREAASPTARSAVAWHVAGGGPFDLSLAYDLYLRLFPPRAREFLRGKDLIIVPAPELIGLPWHLLLTAPPPDGWQAAADRAATYRSAAWLFQTQPSITVLPSVSSLLALRGDLRDQRGEPFDYIGFADPVIGRTSEERLAPPMDCGGERSFVVANDAGRGMAASPSAMFLGARDEAGFVLAESELVRSQPRLPDTRCEVESVAAIVKIGGSRTEMFFGVAATEERIKALDRSGDLRRYGVLHFATHGLVGGELGLGEPGLVLTPPAVGSTGDDGILTASEIALLSLDADWVILSACNTAAGSGAEAEALSGLAKSFFYAGARSLLVSSWPVYSSAAVKVVRASFRALARDPKHGRARALTMAMREVLASAASEREAHPAYWAPFLLVGDGASRPSPVPQ